MQEHAKPRKATAGAVAVLMASLACLAVSRFLSLSSSKPNADQMQVGPMPTASRPDLSTLAPGAWTAIRNALGDDGIARITNIISNPNQGFFNTQHGQSGLYHGHPYGLAFDIAVGDDAQGEANARALRLQGIAAWYRGSIGLGRFGGFGNPHLHCVWPGAPTSNPVNLEQIASFVHGYLCMGNEGPRKADWTDPSIKPDEIACVTRAYYCIGARKPLDKIVTYDALHATETPPGR